MKKHKLIVFSIIKNGIQNGYPFVECFGSWLDYCDHLFVLDGGSNDGTDIVLSQMAELTDKFSFASSPWPERSSGGSAIAEFTNQALEMVKYQADRLMYIQADEIFTRNTRLKIRNWTEDKPVEFTRYVLFWNSFYRVIVFDEGDASTRSTSWHAIRLFPATNDIKSTGDGLSFDTKGAATTCIDDEILHYGWNFPVNILQKHVSHASLYPDNWRYKKRGNLARRMLRNNNFDNRLLDALDPEYMDHSRPFLDQHPVCVQHLLGRPYYDPYIGLKLLQHGMKW